jgi:hypothetical protein
MDPSPDFLLFKQCQMKKIILIVCSFTLLYACKNRAANELTGTANVPQLPSKWQHLDSADAVILGKNSYNRGGNNDTDFVVIVNLAAGGGIRILDSVYSADACSPVFHSWSVTNVSGKSFWNLFKTSNSFAMANLQFFNYAGAQIDTARVCYPIYYMGKYISQGCADGTCGGDQSLPKRIIIFSDTISVLDYPGSTPCSNYRVPAGATAAIVGNHPLANRDSGQYVARTYLAKQGTNLILYTSQFARDADVYSVLQQEFNVAAGDIIMFDGGGSTQMICHGFPYIPSSDSRWVPSAIEIYSAGTTSKMSSR